MRERIKVLNEFDPKFFSQRKGPLVSIYLPTNAYSREQQQDKIRYKNLLAKVEESLSQTYKRSEYASMLETLKAIEQDMKLGLWTNTKKGLAILAGGDEVVIYQLDYSVEEYALVSDNYHIRPLIENFQYGSHYYILALESDKFSLFHGDFHGFEEVPMPEGVETEFKKVFDDFDNAHSGISNKSRGSQSNYFGYKEKSSLVEKDVLKHFRYVNDALVEHFTGENACPIVLVSLPEHQSQFREVSSLPTLAATGIEKPFNSLSEGEVLEQVSNIVRDIQHAYIKGLIGRFDLAFSKERAASDPSQIAMALAERKVETLLLERGRLLEGYSDIGGGILRHSDEEPAQTDDLGDDFAQATYLQNGEVYIVDAGEMPTETGFAALYRY